MEVSLVINNKSFIVKANKTILQVCLEAGIEIPRFCYHEKLSIAGNCRMCLVEILYPSSAKPIASCAIKVLDGMVIDTESNLVRKMRNSIIEFLLINHPLDCPICDQGGECDLQDQTRIFGSDRGRFYENRRSVSDNSYGPLIKTVMTRCIHCTRCIRFLNEIAGVRTLGMLGRGNSMKISSYLNSVILTELSGNIIDICPVGALTSRPYAFKGRPWEFDKVETIDLLDSLHVSIVIETRGLQVLRVLPLLNNKLNDEWITDRTRFFYDGILSQRLKSPYLNLKNAKNYVRKTETETILIPNNLFGKTATILTPNNLFSTSFEELSFTMYSFIFNNMHAWSFRSLYSLNLKDIIIKNILFGRYVFTFLPLKKQIIRLLFFKKKKNNNFFLPTSLDSIEDFGDKYIPRFLKSSTGILKFFLVAYWSRVRSIDLFFRSYRSVMESYLFVEDFTYFFIVDLLTELILLYMFYEVLLLRFYLDYDLYLKVFEDTFDLSAIVLLDDLEFMLLNLQILLETIEELVTFFSLDQNIFHFVAHSYIKSLRGDILSIAFIRWRRGFDKIHIFLTKLKQFFLSIFSLFKVKQDKTNFFFDKNLIISKQFKAEFDWNSLPLFLYKVFCLHKKELQSKEILSNENLKNFSNLNVRFALGSLTSLQLLTFVKDFSKVIGNSSFILPSFEKSNMLDFNLFSSFFNTLDDIENKQFCFLLNFSPRLELPIFNLRLRQRVLKNKLIVWSLGSTCDLTYFSISLGSNINSFLSLLEGKMKLSKRLLTKESTLFIIGMDNLMRRRDYLGFIPYLTRFSTFLIKNLGFIFSYIYRKTASVNVNAFGLPFPVQEYKVFLKSYNLYPYYTIYYMLNFDNMSLYKELKSISQKSSFNNYFIYQGSHNDLTYCNLADIVIPSYSPMELAATYIDIEGKVKTSQSIFYVDYENVRDDYSILLGVFWAAFWDFKPSYLDFPYLHLSKLRERLVFSLPCVEYYSKPLYTNNEFYNFFGKFLMYEYIKDFKNLGLFSNLTNNNYRTFLTNFYVDDYICRCSLNMALISNTYYTKQNNFYT